jgi:hypothetical protein
MQLMLTVKAWMYSSVCRLLDRQFPAVVGGVVIVRKPSRITAQPVQAIM